MKADLKTIQMPDDKGYFGEYGGSFVPPELQTVLDEILAIGPMIYHYVGHWLADAVVVLSELSSFHNQVVVKEIQEILFEGVYHFK